LYIATMPTVQTASAVGTWQRDHPLSSTAYT